MTDDELPIVRRLFEHASWHDAIEAEAGRLINELVAALEPIAKAADNFETFPIKNADEWFCYSGVSSQRENGKGAITVGDLRRARAAIEKARK